MVRRAHKKSRNGCLECKRRHVKCDEQRPICSNCTAAERICEYSTRIVNINPKPPLTASTPIASPSPSAGSPSVAFDDLPVNMLHVELFHNLFTATYTTFDPNGSLTWLPEVVSHTIKTPYLVNEMLAFSALHLSTTRPAQRDYYHYHAAQLQTQALAIFKETSPEVTQETCIPLFFFSSVLGIHMLCDTLIYRENDFDHFLTRFVHYLRLHHGVRAIISQAWSMLLDSILKPAFNSGIELYQSHGPLAPGCEKLQNLIIAANLGTELTETYQRAIKSLQACINIANAEHVDHVAANAVITWPILVKLEFSDLLEQRRPEALVILAHYAVLLHRYRDSWLFGDSGRFIIEEVTRYLGSEFEEWLEWPLEALQSPN
ncbi:hypothetical protein BDW59DRAFT_153409 [Aspergillus cavernicola]|uniref:Zn(2)-C6 fungal-type domain-containing protein n=1 Tax=Aspergillus cavernicola TaxID=176166 RepID=A0ABR4HL30_9EURO